MSIVHKDIVIEETSIDEISYFDMFKFNKDIDQFTSIFHFKVNDIDNIISCLTKLKCELDIKYDNSQKY